MTSILLLPVTLLISKNRNWKYSLQLSLLVNILKLIACLLPSIRYATQGADFELIQRINQIIE